MNLFSKLQAAGLLDPDPFIAHGELKKVYPLKKILMEILKKNACCIGLIFEYLIPFYSDGGSIFEYGGLSFLYLHKPERGGRVNFL
jgi:hypothetical protein